MRNGKRRAPPPDPAPPASRMRCADAEEEEEEEEEEEDGLSSSGSSWDEDDAEDDVDASSAPAPAPAPVNRSGMAGLPRPALMVLTSMVHPALVLQMGSVCRAWRELIDWKGFAYRLYGGHLPTEAVRLTNGYWTVENALWVSKRFCMGCRKPSKRSFAFIPASVVCERCRYASRLRTWAEERVSELVAKFKNAVEPSYSLEEACSTFDLSRRSFWSSDVSGAQALRACLNRHGKLPVFVRRQKMGNDACKKVGLPERFWGRELDEAIWGSEHPWLTPAIATEIAKERLARYKMWLDKINQFGVQKLPKCDAAHIAVVDDLSGSKTLRKMLRTAVDEAFPGTRLDNLESAKALIWHQRGTLDSVRTEIEQRSSVTRAAVEQLLRKAKFNAKSISKFVHLSIVKGELNRDAKPEAVVSAARDELLKIAAEQCGIGHLRHKVMIRDGTKPATIFRKAAQQCDDWKQMLRNTRSLLLLKESRMSFADVELEMDKVAKLSWRDCRHTLIDLLRRGLEHLNLVDFSRHSNRFYSDSEFEAVFAEFEHLLQHDIEQGF